MRFKKSNCRKKMVFSQPDVPTLGISCLNGMFKRITNKQIMSNETLKAIVPNVCYSQFFCFSVRFILTVIYIIIVLFVLIYHCKNIDQFLNYNAIFQ